MKRILITGASGFIGGHATEHALADGWDVTLLARCHTPLIGRFEHRGARVVHGRLHSDEALAEATQSVDVVLHLAAVTAAFSRDAMMRTNVEGTDRLLRACDGRGVYVVHVSSQAAAGPSVPGADTSESSPCTPLTWYGESKRRSERIVQAWAERPTNRACILRPCVVYGPRDRALLPSFRLIGRGILPLLGDGTKRFSLIHVGDVVSALFHMVDLAESGPDVDPYFVAGTETLTWAQMGQAMAEALGQNSVCRLRLPLALVTAASWGAEALGRVRGRPALLNRQKLIELRQPCWCCSAEKLRTTGWRPVRSLTEGMAETVRWYTEHRWLRPR